MDEQHKQYLRDDDWKRESESIRRREEEQRQKWNRNHRNNKGRKGKNGCIVTLIIIALLYLMSGCNNKGEKSTIRSTEVNTDISSESVKFSKRKIMRML